MDACSFLLRMKPLPPGQFAAFRLIFGGYLAIHFATQLPHATELFSNAGVLGDAHLNPLFGLFPNPLTTSWGGSPTFVSAFIAGLVGLSVLFAIGAWRRTMALLLWFGWAALFNRNNLISNPSLPYVGVILLFCALVPPGESWSVSGRQRKPAEWHFPAVVFWGAWLLMAAGYTFSGLIKLQSPSWVDGTAFRHLIDNPLARPGCFRDLILLAPPWGFKLLTWSALALEILFLPLCFWRRGRLVAWLAMVAMHLGILLLVDFADLSFGMLMIHFFTFDPEWFPARSDVRQPVLFYDGECGLCNAVLRFLLREDDGGRVKFAPLQSAPAQAYLRAHGLPTTDFNSLVFVPDYNRTEAYAPKLRTAGVCAALDEIGGLWRVVSWLRWLPAALRDPAYKLVARTRYALFGEYQPAPLPDPDWERRFLAR